MDNKLEKRFLQQNLNATPKNILEDLFNYMDEKRIKYEEQEFHYNSDEYSTTDDFDTKEEALEAIKKTFKSRTSKTVLTPFEDIN